MNEFIKDLEKKIEKLGSQTAYANAIGVSKAMVSAVVNGKKQPSRLMLDDLGYEKVRVSTYTYTKK